MSDEIREILIKKASHIAMKCHSGQLRSGGEEYIIHPELVASKCKTENGKIIGWLHDTIEDSGDPALAVKQIKESFSEYIFKSVMMLTRHKHDTYFDYIMKLSKCDPCVIAVKLADLEHNMSDSPEGARLDKYRLSYHILRSVYDDEIWKLFINFTKDAYVKKK